MWVKDAGFNLLRACIGFGIHGLVRTSATPRQSCEHFCPCYRTLTRLFKLIATAQWQGCGNRAATARREFRGVKWNPAGPLPGRAVRGRIVQTRPWRLDPFSLPARFRTADAAADEGLGVVDLHRERVILRRALSAMRMAVNLPVAAYRGVAIRLDATSETPPFVASRSNTPTRPCRCRCSRRPILTTLSPNGRFGAPCSACRC